MHSQRRCRRALNLTISDWLRVCATAQVPGVNRVVVSMRIPFRADALKIQIRDGANISRIDHACVADSYNCVDCVFRGLKKK